MSVLRTILFLVVLAPAGALAAVLLSWVSSGSHLVLDHATPCWCVLGALAALALGLTALIACWLRCGPAGATLVGCVIGSLAGGASVPVLGLLETASSSGQPPAPVGMAVLGGVIIGWVGSILPSWYSNLRALLGG
jgi:hypothetical protein